MTCHAHGTPGYEARAADGLVRGHERELGALRRREVREHLPAEVAPELDEEDHLAVEAGAQIGFSRKCSS